MVYFGYLISCLVGFIVGIVWKERKYRLKNSKTEMEHGVPFSI